MGQKLTFGRSAWMSEADDLLGDASKAGGPRLHPTTSFRELVAEMVQSDLEAISRDGWRKDRGVFIRRLRIGTLARAFIAPPNQEIVAG